MKPTINIDVRMMQFSGIGTYIQNLVKHLVKDEQYSWNLLGDTRLINRKFPGVLSEQVGAPIYSLQEQVELLRKPKGGELLHSPHYNAPLFNSKPLVVTVHDLLHFKFPEVFGGARVKLAKLMLDQVVKKAR